MGCGNPFAICGSMAKKHHWKKAKKERCIKDIKKRCGWK